jgi:histidinol-phosphate aminotransferase
VGHPDLIEALERIKNSFNSYPIDKLAIAGAIAAIDDQDYLKRISKAVIQTQSTVAQAWRCVCLPYVDSS